MFFTAIGPNGDPLGLFPVGVPALVTPFPLGTTEYGKALDLSLSSYCIARSDSYFYARAFSKLRVASESDWVSLYHFLTSASKFCCAF